MGIQTNLDEISARSRFQHFRDIVASLYVPVTLTCETPEKFQFASDMRFLGSLELGSGFMTKLKVTRTPRDVARSESDGLMKLILPLSGAIGVRQDKREVLIKPGQFYVDDPARPYEEHIVEDLKFITIHLPRNTVVTRVGGLDAVTAVRFGPELPHSKLALDFITSLSSVWDAVDERSAANLSSIAVELIVAALRERSNQVATASQNYRFAQFQRAKVLIDDNLQDPSLSLNQVAAALGASVRYVSALFSEQQFSYRKYVLQQRLFRCANDLADIRLAHHMVSTIAYSWGFSNSTHFSHAFKTMHGVSPREYRASKLFGRA